ncbi:MAG: phage major capsid protein [Phycisphaerales bacterium]
MEQYQHQRLVDARAAADAELREILTRCAAEGRERTAEERTAYDKADADYVRLTKELRDVEAQIERDKANATAEERNRDDQGRRAHELGTSVEKVRTADEEHAEAFRSLLTSASINEIPAEHRTVLDKRSAELRAQGVITGAAGGYAAPPGWWAKITETLKFYGGMMEVGVEEISTATGNPISWPTSDDTSNSGSWVGENADVGAATDLSFGARQLSAHMLTTTVLKASLSYLQDVDPMAAEAFITRKLSQRIGRTLNTALTTGDGLNKPHGIISGLSTGKTTASATAITYAELIDLEHSVDRAYRGNAKYMMHDLILAYVRKIVDSNGMPIYQVSYRVGEPDTVNGRPIIINNDMDSTVATTKKTMAFGDFRSAYVHRTVNMGGIRRLDERYAELGQVGFISFSRHDGLTQDSSAVKLLVQA